MGDTQFTPGPHHVERISHVFGLEELELRTEDGSTICFYVSTDNMPDAQLHAAATEMYSLLDTMRDAFNSESADVFLDALEKWADLRAKIHRESRADGEGGDNAQG